MDTHESQIVVLSAFLIARIMYIFVKSGKHMKSLPRDIMDIKWVVLKFLKRYKSKCNHLPSKLLEFTPEK